HKTDAVDARPIVKVVRILSGYQRRRETLRHTKAIALGSLGWYDRRAFPGQPHGRLNGQDKMLPKNHGSIHLVCFCHRSRDECSCSESLATIPCVYSLAASQSTPRNRPPNAPQQNT